MKVEDIQKAHKVTLKLNRKMNECKKFEAYLDSQILRNKANCLSKYSIQVFMKKYVCGKHSKPTVPQTRSS